MIIQEIANRFGLGWRYQHPQDVFAEMQQGMHSFNHISWERLARENSVTYPCPAEDAPGQDVVFSDAFPRAGGLAKFAPTRPLPPDEPVDDDYPTVLTTGRQLEHWHTGSMTRRAQVLDALEPEAVASLSPGELNRLGVVPGEKLTITTRRGTITLTARVDDKIPDGWSSCRLPTPRPPPICSPTRPWTPTAKYPSSSTPPADWSGQRCRSPTKRALPLQGASGLGYHLACAVFFM